MIALHFTDERVAGDYYLEYAMRRNLGKCLTRIYYMKFVILTISHSLQLLWLASLIRSEIYNNGLWLYAT